LSQMTLPLRFRSGKQLFSVKLRIKDKKNFCPVCLPRLRKKLRHALDTVCGARRFECEFHIYAPPCYASSLEKRLLNRPSAHANNTPQTRQTMFTMHAAGEETKL